jgi:hypothetical protein
VCEGIFDGLVIETCLNMSGGCPKNIDFVCQNCGTWDDIDEEWRCPDCADARSVADPKTGEVCPRCDGELRQSHDAATRLCATFCRRCGKEHDSKPCEECAELKSGDTTPASPAPAGGAGAPAAK